MQAINDLPKLKCPYGTKEWQELLKPREEPENKGQTQLFKPRKWGSGKQVASECSSLWNES
jgi:hypothetical protein